MISVVLNKYRNELGRQQRKLYEGGFRNEWCNRSYMRTFQIRPDRMCPKSGPIQTFILDNLILEIYGR